jgi:hypothetical protein
MQARRRRPGTGSAKNFTADNMGISALLSGDYRMVDALARVGVVRASSDNGSPCFGERHLAAAPLPMMLLSN